jgi:hypothetical protein
MVSRAYGSGAISPQERLINMLKRGPMTRDQIVNALGRSTAGEVLSRLRRAGFIVEEDGEIRLTEARG